jgi:hypothetical protein
VKLFSTSKDGGKDSNVTGYWLIEWKDVFSVALLKFDKGSREAFHSHAFNCISWVLSGHLLEERLLGWPIRLTDYKPSWKPIITPRAITHKVYGIAPTTWVITFRGPWHKTWHEEFDDGTKVVLAHGRLPVLT